MQFPWLQRLVDGLPGIRGRRTRDFLSFSVYAARRFNEDAGLQAAASLTYTTLLGIVPVMAIFLAILAGFPTFDQVREDIKNFILAPLVPDVSAQAREQIDIFLANTRQLTGVGILGLAVTSFLLLWTVESAFNTIWRVVEPRSWSTRLLAFWAILTLSPVAIGISVSLSNYLEYWSLTSAFGTIARFIGSIPVVIPLIVESLIFALMFAVIPHRRPRWRHCLIGGAVAGVLFEILKNGFGLYLSTAETYRVVYGALATIPIFLLWLYLSWSVVLFGAEVAAAIPDWRADRRAQMRSPPPPAEILAMALATLREIWNAPDDAVVRRDDVEETLPGGGDVFGRVLASLIDRQYVAVTEDQRLVIARDLSEVTLYRLQSDLGLDLGTELGPDFSEHPDYSGRDKPRWFVELNAVLARADASRREILGLPIKQFLAPPAPEHIGQAAQ